VKASKTMPYRRLDVAEVRRLHGKAKGNYRLLVALGYSTGLRLVDCALLEWPAVDLAGGFLRVIPRKTANRKRRAEGGGMVTPPILPDVAALLPKAKRKGFVMPAVAADYQSQTIGGKLAKLFDLAKVKDTTAGRASFHSLRVTWMTLNDEAGTSRIVSRAILGHQGAAMSDHYSRADASKARDAVEKAIPRITG